MIADTAWLPVSMTGTEGTQLGCEGEAADLERVISTVHYTFTEQALLVTSYLETQTGDQTCPRAGMEPAHN